MNQIRNMMQYRALNSSDDFSMSTVEHKDNHVYFYADVDSDNGLKLMQKLREADATLRSQHISRGVESLPLVPIWLHINSYGGDLFTGFSIADQLALIKSPVYSIVEGICASATTLISMSCQKRFILPNSFMLVHQLSSMVWGTHEKFKDEMQLQSKVMDRLIEFYAAKSSVKKKDIRKMLQRDYWMDAETALKDGFVDEILGQDMGKS